MPTKFILNPPVDVEVFERDMRLPKETEHRVSKKPDGRLVESITVATDSDSEILEIETELRNMLNVTPIIEHGVDLDPE